MFNQDCKADKGKLQLRFVPKALIKAVAVIRMYGIAKYHAPENWRHVERERYIDAMYRHWVDVAEDPLSLDEESGYPHLWHCACNIAFLCDMYEEELNARLKQKVRRRSDH